MEVEAKVRIVNIARLRKKLEAVAARFSSPLNQFDAIYRPKGRELATQGPGDFMIRIRQSSQNSLTVKGLTDRVVSGLSMRR